jgi:Na+-translocating ferredoxin:NAD+ oxidoreductase RNF subunit RnfB
MPLWMIVVITLVFSFLLAFILGTALGFFREHFKVERNPLIDKSRALLPGANCGACGYPGCDAYAVALAEHGESVNLCFSGGKAVAERLSGLLGRQATAEDEVAVLRCQGVKSRTVEKGDYEGVRSCRAAKLSTNGIKLCPWGCVGFGDCVKVCAFDALRMGDDGLPIINYDKCVGCGMCSAECPQGIFALVPKSRVGAVALCSNRSSVKHSVTKGCKVGCVKCEVCVRVCPRQAITMVNGLPEVNYSLCDSCGACVQRCPTKVFQLHEKITALKEKTRKKSKSERLEKAEKPAKDKK